MNNHIPKFQLKLNEDNEIDFRLSIEGSVSDQEMAKPTFRFVMTENSSDRGCIFPVKIKSKGSDIFTVKIPALNESAKENALYSGRLEVIMGNVLMVPTEVMMEFKKSTIVTATPVRAASSSTTTKNTQPDIVKKLPPQSPPVPETIDINDDSLEEEIDAVISSAKPTQLSPRPNTRQSPPAAPPTPVPEKKANPMLFNNVMFLEEQNIPRPPSSPSTHPEKSVLKKKLKAMFKTALK